MRAAKPVAALRRMVAAVRPEQAVRLDRMSRLECPVRECRRSEFQCQRPAVVPVAARVSKADTQVRMPLAQVEVPAAARLITRAFSPGPAVQAAVGSKVNPEARRVRKADRRVRAAEQDVAAPAPPAILVPRATKREVRERIRVQVLAKAAAEMVGPAVTPVPAAVKLDRLANRAAVAAVER